MAITISSSISIIYRFQGTNSTHWLGHTISAFILSTPSIRVGPVSAHCWGASCFFGQTWGCGICYRCIPVLFNLEASSSCFFFFLKFFSSCLLSLQFLSKAIALSYHCSMELGCHSESISLWCIVPFMHLLNSSTKSLPSYLLPLVTLLNSYINFSIVFPPCSILFSSATLTVSSSLPSNPFLYLLKISLLSHIPIVLSLDL